MNIAVESDFRKKKLLAEKLSKVSCAMNAKFYFSWFAESSISQGSRATQRENVLREKYNHKDKCKQIKINNAIMLRVAFIEVRKWVRISRERERRRAGNRTRQRTEKRILFSGLGELESFSKRSCGGWVQRAILIGAVPLILSAINMISNSSVHCVPKMYLQMGCLELTCVYPTESICSKRENYNCPFMPAYCTDTYLTDVTGSTSHLWLIIR